MAISSTSFSKSWKHSPTRVIRVPESMADALIDLARKWDAEGIPRDIQVLTAKQPATEYQLDLPTLPKPILSDLPINVASVPQLSPFRYPGGKTWFVPYLRAWLSHVKPKRFLEPFAGGAIASLTAASEGLANEIIFTEIDDGVAAVWKTILSRDFSWLVNQITSFDLTEEHVRTVLSHTPKGTKELAFLTILRNRVQRGGILAPGAGLVKNGESGKGLRSRWYPETLARRITAIHNSREYLRFEQMDAFEAMQRFGNDSDTALYIDPPYTVAAKRLYLHWQINHRELFKMCATSKGNVLMSYDNTEQISEWAQEFAFSIRSIAMKNTHHSKMSELLIAREMGWFDGRIKKAA